MSDRERRKFISDFFLLNSVHLKSDDDADTMQRRAEKVWRYFIERNPAPGKQSTELSTEELKQINFLQKQWAAIPKVNINKTKPTKLKEQVASMGLTATGWAKLNVAVRNYCQYMTDTGRGSYVPGLQKWLEDGEYEQYGDEKQRAIQDGADYQKAVQDLKHLEKLYADTGNESLAPQVEAAREKIRALQPNG